MTTWWGQEQPERPAPGADRQADRAVLELVRAEVLPRLPPEGHPARATALVDLGRQLVADYEANGCAEVVDEAVALCRRALRDTPVADVRRAAHAEALGAVLTKRFHATGSANDLNDAIVAYRDALRAPRADSTWDRTACQAALGDLVGRRYARTGRRADLDEAISRYRTAAHKTPRSHPTRRTYLTRLAEALTVRGKLTGSTLDLDEATDATAEATTPTP
ncbi:hypothetical protein [Saccharothrix syringae]|uniref:Tetratricopeptide repeat protein n=1 Tax=Saccharothrix syringae TaxID=103733 RepID=A0A5Q0GZR4_SACSY|nr:hypothetical protein [Saccharothrix syringae]QFZ19487.1 hypothetical protein EKG83_20430 [Saccharothrix syringae]